MTYRGLVKVQPIRGNGRRELIAGAVHEGTIRWSTPSKQGYAEVWIDDWLVSVSEHRIRPYGFWGRLKSVLQCIYLFCEYGIEEI